MKIGLISDTHGYMDERIRHYFKTCDEIWHMGDIGNPIVTGELKEIAPLKVVFGNIDDIATRKSWSEHLFFSINGLGFLMIHIAGGISKYNPKTVNLIEQHRPDVLLCGHSHILKVKHDPRFKLLYINPGAAGKHGFHKVRTICTMEIENNNLTNFKAIELGSR
ncbi:MAG: metallophosphoesterase family protein [Salibacteraceae bacterium]